jgi:hypothetical protein
MASAAEGRRRSVMRAEAVKKIPSPSSSSSSSGCHRSHFLLSPMGVLMQIRPEKADRQETDSLYTGDDRHNHVAKLTFELFFALKGKRVQDRSAEH